MLGHGVVKGSSSSQSRGHGAREKGSEASWCGICMGSGPSRSSGPKVMDQQWLGWETRLWAAPTALRGMCEYYFVSLRQKCVLKASVDLDCLNCSEPGVAFPGQCF